MKIRIASYNVENLFERPAVMNLPNWSDGKPTLDAYGKLNDLLQKKAYSAADKAKIVALLKELGLGKSDESKFVILRQNRGHLLKRPKSGPPQVVANGRGDWIGWLELKWEPVNETAVRMTGQVVRDVAAHIQGIVEVESRVALTGFNKQIVGTVANAAFGHAMVIDGNDERGIDVGMMTRSGFEIVSMRSHVDDMKDGNAIFSRDCAEYEIALPGSNKTLWVLMNHFKSKGFGSQATSNAKRKLQATRTREIYQARKAAGADWIVVMGDFNDTPDGEPLAPLLTGSDLKDIQTLPGFDDGGRPGTFGNGAKSNKIDFLLLSPALQAKASGGGIFRKGVWGGTNGTLFPHYPEITKAAEAASDHAAIFADLDL